MPIVAPTKKLSAGHNFVLTQGQPRTSLRTSKQYTHGDRLIAVGNILNGTETIQDVSDRIGVVRQTVKNWIATFSACNPRLDG